MKPVDNIKKLFENAAIITNPKVDEMVFDKVLTAQEKVLKSKPAISGSHIKTTLMKSRFIKLAAAAVIIIAVLIGINQFNGASFAWGEVTRRIDHVDFVHLYELKFRGNRVNSSMEVWFSDGRFVAKKDNGSTFFDDGKTQTVFDKDGQQTRKEPSELANMKGTTFFEKITQGLMLYENNDILTRAPSFVGDDFLIYKFDAPADKKEWVQTISITVGKNSLLPVQMKIHRKDQDDAYDLYIFDYEEPEKPTDFFSPHSIVKPPQGVSEIVLNGEEVIIDISGSPGIKSVAGRLYQKHFENTGELTVLDLAVITSEGFRRGICKQMPLKLNKESQFSLGDSKHWPDKKFRFITAKIKLKLTEEENIYLLEVSCWFEGE